MTATHCYRGLCGTACRCGCFICATPQMAMPAPTADRLTIVGHALEQIDEATQLGGVTASRLAEMLGYRVGELYLHRIQNVANTTFEAGTEFVEACKVLGVEEGIAAQIAKLKAVVEAARDVARASSWQTVNDCALVDLQCALRELDEPKEEGR